MDHQIILLAHGSRDSRWCGTFEELATATLQAVPGSRIAYMELAAPSLRDIVEEGCRRNLKDYSVVPLFLAAGRHLRKDIPAMIDQLEKEYSVSIRLLPPIGENPVLGEAIRDIVISTMDMEGNGSS